MSEHDDGGRRPEHERLEDHSGPEKLATPPHQTDSAAIPPTDPTRSGAAPLTHPAEQGLAGAPHPAEEIDRRAERRAERLVALFFTISVLGTLGFIVTNFVGDKHRQYYTPSLGMSLALALGGIGFGLVIWVKRLMPHVQAVQERGVHVSSETEIAVLEETVSQGYADTGLARRPLLRRSLLGAGLALGGVFVVPLLNLYNSKPGRALFSTQWAKGARLVTDDGTFVKLGDLDIGGIATVFPAVPVHGADGNVKYEPKLTIDQKAQSATVLIRLAPGENRPRKGRENWAYDGHVAYSKICTHAGCPVSLYEQQTHHLLCPCHQSVFDVVDGARAIFGPASRSLPQLPLDVDADGYLIARDGDYHEPVGPAFWERP